MAYKIDVDGGDVVAWHTTDDGVEPERVLGYHPTMYVTAPAKPLATLRERLAADPKVVETSLVEKYHDLHADIPEPALEVTVDRLDDVKPLAREIRGVHEPDGFAPGTFRCYDVDLSPQFRYCLDADVDPMPTRPLSTLELTVGEKPLADGDVTALEIGGDLAGTTPTAVLGALATRLEQADPDVLVVSHSALVPLLFEAAESADIGGFQLGRRPGYSTLAGSNTVVSYGQVGFSPARYDVPGRALIDTSNSFLWSKTGLDGIEYFVEQAKRPLQEVAWGSIGTILTAMQTREARKRDVLVPWNKWEPESFKSVETLHGADRGGVTFSSRVGFHESVEELDFASLYPNIMIEKNVSPETVGCERHPRLDTVPEIGYPICDEDGFVPEVLEPMVEDRADCKAELESTTNPDRREEFEHKTEAIKWILVSCFGYQGYRNAKFGRIEAHEAINAYARDILLETKAIVEDAGWEVVHGIIDSIWLRQCREDATPIETLCAAITERFGIALEHEHTFEWICFVPRRGESSGALTRYFGKLDGRSGEDPADYKLRGIECRQHSTPAFIVRAQLELIRTLDSTRDPAAVCDRLGLGLRRLEERAVLAEDLLISKRASKTAGEYDRASHVAGALERGEREGIAYHPGQSVRYLVVDDGARRPADGVRLHFESLDAYDVDYYRRELIRAAESVLSPLGWDRTDIRRHLADHLDARLSAFERDVG